MSYDPACEDLARHFLPTQTADGLVQQLSQRIQDSIEEWLESYSVENLPPASEILQ